MKRVKYQQIEVLYEPNLNGGGMDFGQDYLEVIRSRYDKVFDYTYEFCSGPGFIGFSLLANGLTERLCLSDRFVPAYQAMAKTVAMNHLEEKVDCFCVEGVRGLNVQGFDLVVANPPHFTEKCEWLTHIEDRIYIDEDWAVHREFYENIPSRLRDDGIILMQENALGSSRNSFEQMIEDSGLEIVDDFPMKNRSGNDQIYYLEICKASSKPFF